MKRIFGSPPLVSHFARCRTLSLCAIAAMPIICSARNYEVYPGSAFYMTQLLDRNLWPYTATFCNGLYHHPVGFQELTDAQETLYTSHFTNRFAMVEGDMGSGSTTGDLGNLQRMIDLNLTPVAAFVNRVSPNPTTWRELVRNNASKGAPTYGMTAPHRIETYPGGWYDANYDYVRTNVLYQGSAGSGVDAPVHLFVNRPEKYRQVIYDQRNWTVQQANRKFNYLISPNNSYNETLLTNTRATVRMLEDNDAEPDVYGVVLYGERPVDLTPESRTINGVVQANTTITGLAYYLLKHRDGEPGTLDLYATAGTTNHGLGIWGPTSNTPIPFNPNTTNTFTLTVANNSPWLDYAGSLRTRLVGDPSKWNIQITRAGTNVTSSVTSRDGLSSLGQFRWNPSTQQSFTLTFSPIGPATPMKLIVEALPHRQVDHALDVLVFENAITNSPPTLALPPSNRITLEGLSPGPWWFTVGDAETDSRNLTVTATSLTPTLIPQNNLQLGSSGIQRWLRAQPAAGQWGTGRVRISVTDGTLTTTQDVDIEVTRTTVLDRVKANNLDDLQLGSSWTTGTVPGLLDRMVWNSTITGPSQVALAAPLAAAGISLNNPGGPVTITGNPPLTLGYGGVNLTGSNHNLALQVPLILEESSGWTIPANRTVTLERPISGGGGITKSGEGALLLSEAHSFLGPLNVTAGSVTLPGPGTQSGTVVSSNAVLRASNSAAFGLGNLAITAANSNTARIELLGDITVLAGASLTLNARNSNTDAVVSTGNNTLGANVTLSTGGSIYAFSSNQGTLTLSGTLSGGSTGTRNITLRGPANGRITGNITNGSGTVGIIKSGAGEWQLSGTLTHTGPTSVLEGSLRVSNTLPGSALTVAAAAQLTGPGTVTAPTTIAGTHAPADLAGNQSFSSSLTYQSGSTILWDLPSNSGTGADSIASAATRFEPNTSLRPILNGPGSATDFEDPFWLTPRSWTVLTATSLEGAPTLLLPTPDATGKPASSYGAFSIVTSGNNLLVTWTPHIWNASSPTGVGAWSTASHWSSGLPPSADLNGLRFFTNIALPSATIPSSNDLTAFSTNLFQLAGTGPATGTTSIQITGNPITLATSAGLPPNLRLDATNGSGLTYQVATPLVLAAPLDITGNGTAAFLLNGSISGDFGITKNGTATLRLGAANSFTGPLEVRQGIVFLNHLSAASSAQRVVVSSGASLRMDLSGTYAASPLTLAGSGASGQGGALALRSGGSTTTTVPGQITLEGSTRISTFGVTMNQEFSGGITGNGNLILTAEGGGSTHTSTFTLSGSSDYSGTTLLESGLQSSATLRTGRNQALPTSTVLTLLNRNGRTSRLDLRGFPLSLAGLTATSSNNGSLANSQVINSAPIPATLTLNLSSPSTFDGRLGVAPNTAFDFRKEGTATLTLTGQHDLTGSVTAAAGTLRLTGSQNPFASASDIRILPSATLDLSSLTATTTLNRLSGSGTVLGSVILNGIHQPDPTQTLSGTATYTATGKLRWTPETNTPPSGPLVSAARIEASNGAAIQIDPTWLTTAGDFSSSFWKQPRQWTLASATISINGSFAIDPLTTDSKGAPVSSYGSFSTQSSAQSLTITWTPAAPYTSWNTVNFGPSATNPSIAGPLADPDADGLPNLVEYALGLRPLSPDSALAPAVTDRLSITFPRNTSATDVNLRVTVSTDLNQTWQTLATSTAGAPFLPTTPGTLCQESAGFVTVSDAVPTSTHLRRFLRIEVEKPTP